MKKSIFLFRHGQTHFNKRSVFTGWKDSKLTKRGVKDAKTVARKLKDKRIDVAFTTCLSRSRDTMKEVLKFHPECKLKVHDDRMVERCYGELQGRTHEAFIAEHGEKLYKLYHRSYDVPPPKGESIKMVEKRVLPFVKDLLKFIKKYKVNVAISAHGNSMRPFRRYFEKFSVKEMMQLENPYDEFFEYKVEVSKGPSAPLTKAAWLPVHKPMDVKLATDKRNPLKKYYR